MAISTEAKNASSFQGVDVVILGNRFTIRSALSPEDINRLVQIVENRIKDAQARSRTMSLQSASLITALGFAGELLELQQRVDAMKKNLQPELARLHELLLTAEERLTPPAEQLDGYVNETPSA